MNKKATLTCLASLKSGAIMLLMYFLLFSSDILAQINYSQNWNAGSIASWTNSSSAWSNWSVSNSQVCEGAGMARKNIYSSS
jgi:hypothetical protein